MISDNSLLGVVESSISRAATELFERHRLGCSNAEGHWWMRTFTFKLFTQDYHTCSLMKLFPLCVCVCVCVGGRAVGVSFVHASFVMTLLPWRPMPC